METLQARRRVGTGKGAGRRIRAKGMIPAVLYGMSDGAVSIAVDPKAVRNLLLSPWGTNTSFGIEIDGGETVPLARIADFQKDPVKRNLIHCDFQRIDPSAERIFQIPIILDGISEAQNQGGRITFVTRNADVLCLPASCPQNVIVDITEIEIGDSIRISELDIPDNVKLLYTDDVPVVVGAMPGVVEVEEEEEELEGEEGEEGEEGAAAKASSTEDKTTDSPAGS